MRERIEQALQALVGMPLWASGRAADLQWFQFGEEHEVPIRPRSEVAGTKVVGEYALHLQCAWRLAGPQGIIVASRDRFVRAGEDPYRDLEDFDWDVQGANRRDERMAAFFQDRAAAPPSVVEAEVDEIGGFRLHLSGGVVLEAFPDDPLPSEHWRLLQPGPPYTEERHFVVTGQGIE